MAEYAVQMAGPALVEGFTQMDRWRSALSARPSATETRP